MQAVYANRQRTRLHRQRLAQQSIPGIIGLHSQMSTVVQEPLLVHKQHTRN